MGTILRTMAMLGVVLGVASCRRAESPARRQGADSATVSHGLNHQDELLLAAANVALPPAGIGPADLPDPNSRGAQLEAQVCAQCHALPSPQMHSAVDWPSIARRMWLRTELLPASLGITVPSAAERLAILDYLTSNALRVSGASLPAGSGREAFGKVCSQCHALPDPRTHSREDWPTVYRRMEQNMERMRVPPPTRDQTTDILLYLQTVASRQ